MLNLLANTQLTEKQRHYVRIAESSADALLSLISQVLDFSKIEAGKLELEHTEFDLHALLEDTTEMFVHQTRHKGLELTCRVGPAVPQKVLGDPERIRQILINLLANAVKFTAQGQVAIRADAVEQDDRVPRVRFEVRDSGIGIPEERRDILFDAFSQVDASTTRKFGGTGLGLSICKQLVELMAGCIELESQPGQGSTFSFTIPLEAVPGDAPETSPLSGGRRGATSAADRQTAEALPSQPNDELGGNGASPQDLAPRVLIAEDNEINQLVTGEILGNAGFCCDIAANGRLAIAAILRRPYDLVLMDCQMPEMDGFAATREIRKLEEAGCLAARRRRLPVIAITAHAVQGDRERCLAAGMDDYVSKPVSSAELFSAIYRFLPDRSPAARPRR
jgi:CheY-like chemotaxis protein